MPIPPFPSFELSRLAQGQTPADPGAVVADLRRVYDAAVRADQQAIYWQCEAQRLRHENEFLLRLINRHIRTIDDE